MKLLSLYSQARPPRRSLSKVRMCPRERLGQQQRLRGAAALLSHTALTLRLQLARRCPSQPPLCLCYRTLPLVERAVDAMGRESHSRISVLARGSCPACSFLSVL